MVRNVFNSRSETSVETEETLLLGNRHRAVERATIGQLSVGALGLLLESGLDKVEGQAEERGKEAGNAGGAEVAQCLLSLVALKQSVLAHLSLGLGVEGELAKVECHGAGNSRKTSVPERQNTLGLGNPAEGVDDGGVVFSFGEGAESVRLHADQGKIARVSQNSSETTGSQ